MSLADYAEAREMGDAPSGSRRCPWCHGSGRECVERDGRGSLSYRCPDCEGTGRIVPEIEQEYDE